MFLLVSKFKTIYECYCTLCRVTPQKSEQKHITKNSDGLYNHCSAKYAINIVTKWCRDLGSQASFVQMLDSVYPWNKLLSVALISIEETNFVINRPFHVFFFLTFDMDQLGKICQPCWKKRLQITNMQLLKITKFYRSLYGGRQTFVNFRDFAEPQLRTLETYHFQTWQFY